MVKSFSRRCSPPSDLEMTNNDHICNRKFKYIISKPVTETEISTCWSFDKILDNKK